MSEGREVADARPARERLELAARAAFAAFGHDVATPTPWAEVPEDFRVTFRMVADAVLMVADARPAPDPDLVDQVAEAMTGWPLATDPSAEDAEAWRANARAAINAVREHDGLAGWRALIDAANAWQRGEWANAPRSADRVQERIANGQYVGDWLRDRAAALPSAAGGEEAALWAESRRQWVQVLDAALQNGETLNAHELGRLREALASGEASPHAR